MQLLEFDFELPRHLIARHPRDRGCSKLLHLNKKSTINDLNFSDIVSLFKKGDLLILNDSKVIPAYLIGQINFDQNRSEEVTVYLNKQTGPDKWTAYIRPIKKIFVGNKILFSKNLEAYVEEHALPGHGQTVLKFNYSKNLLKKICEIGMMPIPPYLKRRPELSDNINYQTVYSREYGSVAAPTAGLHFTKEIIDSIENLGVVIRYITLHVGSGTFLPVKSNEIKHHKMHPEDFYVSQDTADRINETKSRGNRVICVGTTSLRAIESSCCHNGIVKSQDKETDIFITPGYKFKVVDCLITNFHTPKSTLMMLVSAFSGVGHIRKAYLHAMSNNYKFFSYGDVCWLDNVS